MYICVSLFFWYDNCNIFHVVPLLMFPLLLIRSVLVAWSKARGAAAVVVVVEVSETV
jgi:hypothetical protein